MKIPIDYGIDGVNVDHDLSEAINIMEGITSNEPQELEFIVDNQWLVPLAESSIIMTHMRKLKSQNVSVKIITEHSKYNTVYCKKLMKYSEIRHTDGLKGCSVRNEKEYFFDYFSTNDIGINNSFEQQNNILDNPSHFFYFKNESFINQQKLLFSNLWDNSVPVRLKITDLEKKVIEKILNPQDVINMDEISKEILFKIIRSSVDQMLIVIPSVDLFWSIYNNGLLRLISETILRDVTVKLLIHLQKNELTNHIKEDIHQVLKEFTKDLDINTNFFSKQINQSHVSLIVDNAVLIELKNEHPTHDNALLIPVYSTNDTKISSATSIFDLLWIESDIERQKKIKQTYFDIFKGFNMKNENYARKWKFENDNIKNN